MNGVLDSCSQVASSSVSGPELQEHWNEQGVVSVLDRHWGKTSHMPGKQIKGERGKSFAEN